MQFEKWYDIDLKKPRQFVPDIGFPTFEGDNNSVRIGVNVFSDKTPSDVTGTIKGYCILPNGVALMPWDGAKDGNRAWIDVPDDALIMNGRITLSIRCFDADETTVLFQASATVRRVDSERHYDPEDEIGDVTDLIEEAERVSGVAAQAAQDAQNALAQASDIVSYATQTGQTDAQKATARTNIGAVSEQDVADLKGTLLPYIEDSMVATRDYTSGEILMVGSAIYKAKRNITSGTELTSTNVSEITLREYLSGTGLAFGNLSHAEGDAARASGTGAHAEGYKTIAGGNYSHAEGNQTSIISGTAHAEGVSTQANGNGAHSEGLETQAFSGSHAEGYKSKTSASYSHAEGRETTASASSAHSEGYKTTASGTESHAEGDRTTASGSSSHAEGAGTTASGIGAHAEGASYLASGVCSHAEGEATEAEGDYSHSEGWYTKATHAYQHVFGSYNISDPSTNTAHDKGTYVEIVGNGTNDNNKSNARTLDWDGNEALAGCLTLGKGTADEVELTAANVKALLALLN